MTYAVSHPDLPLEQFTGLDSNEDARDFHNIIEKR